MGEADRRRRSGEGHMGDKSRFSSLWKQRSRELRQNQTIAEQHAWYLLRDRQTLGLKFRRQVPIEDFIVDFYCDELNLVVEIDGDVHDQDAQSNRDKSRDQRLCSLGYRVLRFPNAIIINDPDVLIKTIRGLRPSPGALRRPLPGGEGL